MCKKHVKMYDYNIILPKYFPVIILNINQIKLSFNIVAHKLSLKKYYILN